MLEIEIHYPTDRAGELLQPLDSLMQRCGFSFKIEAQKPNMFHRGGALRLYYLRLLVRSQTARGRGGINNTDVMDRMSQLLKKLSRNKPFEGRRWFPFVAASARVRCCGQIHTIKVSDLGRLTLCNHSKDDVETERAMTAIAQAKHAPRCLRIFDAWQNTSIREGGGDVVNIPDSLRIAFNLAIFRHYWRKKLSYPIIDPLLLTREQRWKQKGYAAFYVNLSGCKYPQRLNATEHFVANTSRFMFHLSSGPHVDCKFDVTDLRYLGEGACVYTLQISIPSIARWYAKVVRQGVVIVDGSLVLDSDRIDNTRRNILAIRFYDRQGKKELKLEPAVAVKSTDGWHLEWESDLGNKSKSSMSEQNSQYSIGR